MDLENTLLKVIFWGCPWALHCGVEKAAFKKLYPFLGKNLHLTGADCIKRLIQCNTGSLKCWNFDLSSSVSFVSHCFLLEQFPWVIVGFLQFFPGRSFWDLLWSVNGLFLHCQCTSWSFPLHSGHLFWHTFYSFASLLLLDLGPYGFFFHAHLEVRSLTSKCLLKWHFAWCWLWIAWSWIKKILGFFY